MTSQGPVLRQQLNLLRNLNLDEKCANSIHVTHTHWVFENLKVSEEDLREILTQEEALSVIHNIISVLGGIGIPEKKNNVFVAKNFSRNQNIVWMSPGIKNS